jgi:hypothetical protein
MEADYRCWSYAGKYLGRFLRYGTTSYHHDPENIFEYGTLYGNVTCSQVPKQYSWDEIVEAAQVNAKTISYFSTIYAGSLYPYSYFLDIIDEMRDEDIHKRQLDVNEKLMEDLSGNYFIKESIQKIINHAPKL